MKNKTKLTTKKMKKYFINKKYLFNCSSLFNKELLIEQLTIFYQATTVFKILLFKNKYIVMSLIILSLITFLFNKNLDYFNYLTIAPHFFFEEVEEVVSGGE